MWVEECSCLSGKLKLFSPKQKQMWVKFKRKTIIANFYKDPFMFLILVRVEFKSGSRVILQRQDGSISNKHSCADQSGETLLFLFKFRLGLIRRGGLENLIWWQSGKGEEVCVFKLSKEIGFRLPHNRVIDTWFLFIGKTRKKTDILSQMSGAFLLLQLSIGGSKQIIWFAS